MPIPAGAITIGICTVWYFKKPAGAAKSASAGAMCLLSEEHYQILLDGMPQKQRWDSMLQVGRVPKVVNLGDVAWIGPQLEQKYESDRPAWNEEMTKQLCQMLDINPNITHLSLSNLFPSEVTQLSQSLCKLSKLRSLKLRRESLNEISLQWMFFSITLQTVPICSLQL